MAHFKKTVDNEYDFYIKRVNIIMILSIQWVKNLDFRG